jgi:hypothetical protein
VSRALAGFGEARDAHGACAARTPPFKSIDPVIPFQFGKHRSGLLQAHLDLQSHTAITEGGRRDLLHQAEDVGPAAHTA